VVLTHEDIPKDFPDRARLYPDGEEWINPGDSVVIAPGGEMIGGPLRDEKGLLYAEVDTGQVARARRTLDLVGHYARPDIFRLEIDTRPQRPAVFKTPTD